MIKAIIIDGYVDFCDDNLPEGKQHQKALGWHLYDALGGNTPIIGIAKNPISKSKSFVAEVLRGSSKTPLYLSTIGGKGQDKTAQNIANMHGDYRIPTLLKILDDQTRMC